VIDTFFIGKDDTLPFYTAAVRDKNGPMSLSDVTGIYFIMARISTASVIVSAFASVLETSAVDENIGRVRYQWAVSDCTTTGDYAGSFLFVTSAGKFSLPRTAVAKIVVEDRTVTD
jgi:hypothetical protein